MNLSYKKLYVHHPFFFVSIELNVFYPGRISIFDSLNQVSPSTIISGFLFNPSIYGANFQPFLFKVLILKLKINKPLKLAELQLKECWLYSVRFLEVSEISKETIQKFYILITEKLLSRITYKWGFEGLGG